MQKIVQIYLLAMSEYMSFSVGACATAIMTSALYSSHEVLYVVAGGLCVAVSRAYSRQSRFGISPSEQVERYWLSSNESCLTEFSIGSAALVFATAFCGGSIIDISVFVVVLGVILFNIWSFRGTFDISVLK